MRWTKFFRRSHWDEERTREMEHYLQIETDDNIARGMPPEEARFAALRKLGNRTKVREEIFQMNSLGILETLWQDLRYGARMLRKSPGFTIVAVLTLALGIGANTTIFSVVNSLLLRKLPYPGTDRLVLLWQADLHDSSDYNIISAPDFWDYQKQSNVFDSMAIFDSAGRGYNLSQNGEPERVSGVRVSSQFFQVLGVQPMMGRAFLPEEEIAGRDHEVVLAYSLWKRRYASDPAIVGKTIRIDGENFDVVGVMPQTFDFQFWSNPRELWVPVGYTEGDHDRGSNSFVCIARMKPGVTVEQARARMDTIGRRMLQQYPKENANETATAMPLATFGLENLQTTLVSLLAAVGFVLLIACVNVANLTLARTAARQKEIAVRRTLGAGRFRILCQLMTESLLLATLGGVAGLVVAFLTVGFLEDILPPGFRFAPFRPLTHISLDLRVFLFALAVSGLTALLCGLAPALSAQRRDLNEPLKEGGGRGATQTGGRRVRHTLVMAEVALTLVVLAAAGLMIDSVARLLGVEPGYNPHNVMRMDITTPQVNLYYSPPVNPRFCQQIKENVEAVPGVLSASAANLLPMEGMAGRGLTIEGEPDPGPEHQPGAKYSIACPNYFHTMEIPLLEGREFTDRDTEDAPGVIVISEAMAQRYWPKNEALGSRVKIGRFDSDAPWLTVVGIARDVRTRGLDRQPPVEFFRPFMQAGWPTMTIVVRTNANALSFAEPIKAAVALTNPDVPVSDVETLDSVLESSVASRRFPMLLLSAFAVLGLVLASVGIYGVVAYGVTQQTHEIGIRMAFGARSTDVLRLVVGGSMLWTLSGVVIGILGSLGATKLLAGLLFGVSAKDPLVLAGVALLLTFVALLATVIPARRAMRVDPMVALRYE